MSPCINRTHYRVTAAPRRVPCQGACSCHVSRVPCHGRVAQLPASTHTWSFTWLAPWQPAAGQGRSLPYHCNAFHHVYLPTGYLEKKCPVFLYFPPSNNFVKIDRKCSLQGPPLPQLVGAGHKYGKYGKVVRCCCVMLGPARPLLHTDEVTPALSEENWSFCHFGQLILRRQHAGAGSCRRIKVAKLHWHCSREGCKYNIVLIMGPGIY